MKDELGGQIIKEFVELRAERYSYLKSNNDKDKKAKVKKKCFTKRKLKFEDYKNCLKAALIGNKINHLEKNSINVDSFKGDQKEFIKNKKLILKTQQRFKSERWNILLKKLGRLL